MDADLWESWANSRPVRPYALTLAALGPPVAAAILGVRHWTGATGGDDDAERILEALGANDD